MFRIIKYFLIFFLGYYIIRKLFGTIQEAGSNEVIQPTTPPPSEKGPQGSYRKDEGEYIEYEEVK